MNPYAYAGFVPFFLKTTSPVVLLTDSRVPPAYSFHLPSLPSKNEYASRSPPAE